MYQRLNSLTYFLLVLAILHGDVAYGFDANTDSSLVGWWKLDETSGTIAADSSGKGNNGTVRGARWISGKIDGALQFDGVDDYVNCGNSASLNITGQVTLAAWVKTNDSGNSQYNPYVSKSDHSYALQQKDNNNLEFCIYDGYWYWVWYPVDSSFNGIWHHLAGTYDGRNLKLYIDGQLVATSDHAGSIASTAYSVEIGRNSELNDRLYSGVIDDVRIYNRVLSQTEIKKLIQPLVKAGNPDPPDGATAMTVQLLRWTAGDTAKWHNVYFGTNPTPGATELVSERQTDTIYQLAASLVSGTTYYWRIDEVETEGTTIHTGDIWSFKVAANPDYADVLGARFIPSHFTAWGELNLSSGHSIHFDTSWATFSIDGGAAQSGVIAQTRRAIETAVFCFTNITIADGVEVTLTGDRPIVILSHTDMTIGATFDAGGGNGTSNSVGLGWLGGGSGGTGQMAETAPTAGEGPGAGGVPPQFWAWHGGGGGGYGGPGGFGGTESGLPSHGGLSYNTADELEIDLLGGSGGGGGYHFGGGGGNGGCAGAGGGVIELTASGNINILSTGRILADGGSGYDANWRSGGGGGSGGMVLLCAEGTVRLDHDSQISAIGGNGGSSYGGAGGGGGGGGGGQVVVCYYAGLTNNGQIIADAGSGGAGPNANGEDGYDGRIMMRQLGATLSAPAELQFDKVKPTETISLEFYLENFDLLPAVTSIAIVGSDNEYFEVLSPIGAFTVEPGEPNRVPVIVRFNPNQGREYEARLDINSSGGHSMVRLLGECIAGTVRPVLHYKMDDDNELTKITDSSGSGLHGQRANMRACHWIDGRFSPAEALEFDGFDDYISVPAIYPMGAFTIAMWVKPDELTDQIYSSLYCCNGSESGDISLRFKNDGTLEFAVCGNVGGNVSAEVANSIYDRFEEHAGAHPMDGYRGYWIHLAIVYDSTAGTADFYVNGQPNVNRIFSTALPASFAGGQIGGWDGGGRNFDGIIDEFCIYDHALNPEQVEEIAKFEHDLWAIRDIYDWKSPSTVIHVDGQAGNDANPGTQKEPVATIGKALDLVPGPGTKVLVYPGTYREANLQLTKSGTRFEPIIIEANEPGTVVISGSEIWNGWQDIGGGTYTHSWPYDWGDNGWGWDFPEGVLDISRRREMVFVDGELYTQTSHPAGAPAKTYCVDEANDKLYLFMPAGQSPADHMIDVVTGDVLFDCGRDYYALRGLVFQHANVAVWAGGSHTLIEDCSFNYCNSQGIYLGWGGGSEDIVMRRCAGNHNGLRSFYPDRPIFDVLMEDCITNYNNWRLYWGGDIGSNGMKAMFARHMVVRRHEAVSNLAKGLWFDCDNRNVIVEDCLIAHNLTDGIWSEINPDGVTIRDCIIAYNQFTGLIIANSEHLIIENNKIFGNNWQQLGMWEPDEYRDIVGEFTFTDLVTHNLVLKNNWIISETSSEKLLDWAGWSGLYSTMDSQNNKWYRPGARNGFYIDWSNKNWAQWRALVPQDTTSEYLYSKPNLNPPTPDPLGWQTEPTASGNTSISMTATTATDADGVEYYFCNLTDPTHDSGWQSEPTYHDTGLVPDRKYFYRVRARDNSVELNVTWWSVPACAVTLGTATH
jgi:hypothetical protein